MNKKLVYSKHGSNERCGVAYFSANLADYLKAKHINSFYGFSRCDELYINMDIYELNEAEFSSLLNFIKSGNAKKTILIMHDYRFTYLEDEIVKVSDLVINLSGEPALKSVVNGKMIELFTPSSVNLPAMQFKKVKDRPFSLTFGFFSPRKKSFRQYIEFYEFMLEKYPKWFHLIAASSHIGQENSDKNFLSRYFNSSSILVTEFLPNMLLSELISASDLGVFFYPTGIMLNNVGPMSFFCQGKTVITTYGDLTPSEFEKFTIDGSNVNKIDMYNLKKMKAIGKKAYDFYWKNLSWEVFINKMNRALAKTP